MISCKEAALICNKTQYKEASFVEKLKLRIHLLFCKTCSVFTKKSQQLTYLCDKASLYKLSEKEKDQMKERLDYATGK